MESGWIAYLCSKKKKNVMTDEEIISAFEKRGYKVIDSMVGDSYIIIPPVRISMFWGEFSKKDFAKKVKDADKYLDRYEKKLRENRARLEAISRLPLFIRSREERSLIASS